MPYVRKPKVVIEKKKEVEIVIPDHPEKESIDASNALAAKLTKVWIYSIQIHYVNSIFDLYVIPKAF